MKPILTLLILFCTLQCIGQKSVTATGKTTSWKIEKCPLDTISGTIFWKNYEYNNGVSYNKGYYISYCGGVGGNYSIEDTSFISILWASVRGQQGRLQSNGKYKYEPFEQLVSGRFVDDNYKTIPTASVLFMLPSKKRK